MGCSAPARSFAPSLPRSPDGERLRCAKAQESTRPSLRRAKHDVAEGMQGRTPTRRVGGGAQHWAFIASRTIPSVDRRVRRDLHPIPLAPCPANARGSRALEQGRGNVKGAQGRCVPERRRRSSRSSSPRSPGPRPAASFTFPPPCSRVREHRRLRGGGPGGWGAERHGMKPMTDAIRARCDECPVRSTPHKEHSDVGGEADEGRS